MADEKTAKNEWVRNKLEEMGPEWPEKNAERIKRSMRRYNTDDMHFALWMSVLNVNVQRRTGLSFDDLEDWDYWSAYEGDQSPKDAAGDMLDDLGYGEW